MEFVLRPGAWRAMESYFALRQLRTLLCGARCRSSKDGTQLLPMRSGREKQNPTTLSFAAAHFLPSRSVSPGDRPVRDGDTLYRCAARSDESRSWGQRSFDAARELLRAGQDHAIRTMRPPDRGRLSFLTTLSYLGCAASEPHHHRRGFGETTMLDLVSEGLQCPPKPRDRRGAPAAASCLLLGIMWFCFARAWSRRLLLLLPHVLACCCCLLCRHQLHLLHLLSLIHAAAARRPWRNRTGPEEEPCHHRVAVFELVVRSSSSVLASSSFLLLFSVPSAASQSLGLSFWSCCCCDPQFCSARSSFPLPPASPGRRGGEAPAGGEALRPAAAPAGEPPESAAAAF